MATKHKVAAKQSKREIARQADDALARLPARWRAQAAADRQREPARWTAEVLAIVASMHDEPTERHVVLEPPERLASLDAKSRADGGRRVREAERFPRGAASPLRRQRDVERKRATRIPAGTTRRSDGALALPTDGASTTELVRPDPAARWAGAVLAAWLRDFVVPDEDHPDWWPSVQDAALVRSAYAAIFGQRPEHEWIGLLCHNMTEALRWRLAHRDPPQDLLLRNGADILRAVERAAPPETIPPDLTAEWIECALGRTTLAKRGGGPGKQSVAAVVAELARDVAT